MKRAHSLRRRLRSLEMLSEAVGAMKSLAAHHFRLARAALPAAHAYGQCVDQALGVIRLHQRDSTDQPAAIVIVAADLGLCGGYNSQVTAAALDHHARLNAQRVYCVGHRPLMRLRRANVTVHRDYRAPTSVSELTDLLLSLAEHLLADYLEGAFTTLHVISARFEGVGKFTPTCMCLLPITAPSSVSSAKPSCYVTAEHLAAIAVREYLYIRLFQTALDSLASEHGARLVATESAGQWLSEKSAAASRQLASIRREASTQEVLDIAANPLRRKADSSRQ